MALDSEQKRILQLFNYTQLPVKYTKISKSFFMLAKNIVENCPPSLERTKALMDLLESRDLIMQIME